MMCKSRNVLMVVMVVMGMAPPAFAQGAGTSRGQDTEPLGAPARRSVDDVRAVVRQGARASVEQETETATEHRYVVTSRDRSGPLASRAHERGAIDVAPSRPGQRVDLDRDAAEVARRLGPGHTVIVERVGGTEDTHTTYRVTPPLQGVQTRTYQVPARATGDHIHVQPNYEVQRPSPERP